MLPFVPAAKSIQHVPMGGLVTYLGKQGGAANAPVGAACLFAKMGLKRVVRKCHINFSQPVNHL